MGILLACAIIGSVIGGSFALVGTIVYVVEKVGGRAVNLISGIPQTPLEQSRRSFENSVAFHKNQQHFVYSNMAKRFGK
jgi:hypothetical protein